MTADELKQQLELPAVGQIGVVVEDLDRAASFLEASFGLGPFRVEEVEDVLSPERSYIHQTVLYP